MLRSALLAVAAALVATGCPSSDEPLPAGKDVGEACAAARECRAGLVCSAFLCAYPARPEVTCGPPTIQLGAPVGPSADPDPTGCSTSVRAPVLPAFQDLGELTVGDTATFDIPSGTTSFTIYSQEVGTTAVDVIDFQGVSYPNAVVPTNVRLPDLSLFFSDTEEIPTDSRGYQDSTRPLAYFAGFTPTMGAFTAPNTSASLDLVRSAGELPAGTWRFLVNDWARECAVDIPGCNGGSAYTTGRYRIQIGTVGKPMDSPGTLDLEVYVATDSSFSSVPSAANAVSLSGLVHPQIARMVQRFAAYYEQIGVCVGTVTFHDLPQWAKDRWAPNGTVNIVGDGPCSDLSQLFTLALAQNAAVHLFLSDEIYAGPSSFGGRVLGVDGAIPGPSGVPGTITSGALVGLFDLLGDEIVPGACSTSSSSLSTCGTDVLAYVAAHEAGHWLGLYHTTEIEGVLFDTVTDTQRCPCYSCAPLANRIKCMELGQTANPQIMEARFCTGVEGCGGARNLMFWVLDDDYSKGELSPQQGEIVRLNPAVR